MSQARYLIEKASEKAKVLANEFQAGGPRAAVHYVSTESKHLFLTESVKVWVKLDQYPTVRKVAEVAVPTAAHWSEKYNHFVKEMSQKGYVVFGYLPVVPVDDISNAFKQGEAEKKEDATAQKDSDSSDPEVPVDDNSNAFKQGEAEKKEDATAQKDSDSSDSD